MTLYTIRTLTVTLLFTLFTFLSGTHAQNSTSSPFTVFGIGEIEERDFGRTTGLGSVGIGLQTDNFLNRRNPAGLSGIDTLKFILDVSAAVKFSEFRTSTHKEHSVDFNFRNLAVGVRIDKRWTSSVGLAPYSNVGYGLNGQQPTEGTTDQSNSNSYRFSGGGGVNKFYWANAYELFRGLSLGITSSYIFGNITHNEDMDELAIKDTYNVNKIYFDFGLQYSHRFGQHTNVIVGGVYGYQSQMSIQHTTVVSSDAMVEQDRREPDIKTYVPESYGAGFSIRRNQRDAEWILAADYQCKKWSVDHSHHKGMAYTDSHKYSAGLQLTPNKIRPENYLQAIRFQLGACYNRSYLKVNGYQQDDYSVSIGAGLPFRNMSYVNVALNLGELRTGHRGGITERYALLSLNLSLIERWFAKRQWE